MMGDTQWEWNGTKGEGHQNVAKIGRSLRMEGIEDVIDEKLRNDATRLYGRWLDKESIRWNNLLGMNLPELE
ncbi:hypothetical protein BLNAU_8697 [Blattamonas nauphoetae]|uniref:Uncharacterized protein n=1 Tax=Blattamonas nauphoetae TaxID=2049346 RepID=A0ABQ9XXX0_9EUKA|nr:hypothetical protein BLNAU_8697 [Blattamonas nauphoetae]